MAIVLFIIIDCLYPFTVFLTAARITNIMSGNLFDDVDDSMFDNVTV